MFITDKTLSGESPPLRYAERVGVRRFHLSCTPISPYAIHEMDWVGRCGSIGLVLFYSLGVYSIKKYYGKWGRCYRHQLWQARLFSFFADGNISRLHYYAEGMGQAA